MSPVVALHATRRAYRASIRELGLLASQPNRSRPWGVYTFRLDGAFNHPLFVRGRGAGKIEWHYSERSDVWQVAYIGPLAPDRYVANAVILLDSVTPSELQLLRVTP